MTEWADDDKVTTTFGTIKRWRADAEQAHLESVVEVLETLLAQYLNENKSNHFEAISVAIALLKS